ncbi:hypothetical protein BJ322DRAFT_1025802, partial [Thelephora terrestris]
VVGAEERAECEGKVVLNVHFVDRSCIPSPSCLRPPHAFLRHPRTDGPHSRLPVELYDIQLFALSEHFPFVCKYLHEVFKRSLPSFRARYIVGRLDRATTAGHERSALTAALLYPICTQDVVEALFRLPEFLAYGNFNPEGDVPSTILLPAPDLPRRLFRDLKPRVRRPPKCDANHSYALTKAVVAGAVPLVKFLLVNGGNPAAKGAIAVMVAIQRKDLQMVRLLVEGDLGASVVLRGGFRIELGLRRLGSGYRTVSSCEGGRLTWRPCGMHSSGYQ